MKKRLVFDKILGYRDLKKISIIIGPRQVGKTTILRQLQRELGGIFLDMDIFSQYEGIATYEKMIETLIKNGYKKEQRAFFYIFIDEFQRYPELTLAMKSIYDHHDNIKIYATGSSAIGIKSSIQESLAGRKIITYLYPLNFEEFLFFKNKESLIEISKNISSLEKSENYFSSVPELFSLLNEFLIYGGYPEVVLAQTEEEKKNNIRSIFDLYIKKDFAEYVRPQKLRSASILMQQLAINNGQATNFAKYASVSGIQAKTAQSYSIVLEETFIVSAIRPYFTNKNKEISKLPKIYFLDNGVRNYFLGNFSNTDIRSDSGFLFEGFYISELIKKGIDLESIKYYRTKSGEEIDLIIDRYPTLIPIELKFKKKTNARDISTIKRFVQKNKLPTGFVVTIGEMKKIDSIELVDCFRDIK